MQTARARSDAFMILGILASLALVPAAGLSVFSPTFRAAFMWTGLLAVAVALGLIGVIGWLVLRRGLPTKVGLAMGVAPPLWVILAPIVGTVGDSVNAPAYAPLVAFSVVIGVGLAAAVMVAGRESKPLR